MSWAKWVCLGFSKIGNSTDFEELFVCSVITLQLPTFRSAKRWVDASVKLNSCAFVLILAEILAMLSKMLRIQVELRGYNRIVLTNFYCVDHIHIQHWTAFWIEHLHLRKGIGVELSAVVFRIKTVLRAGRKGWVRNHDFLSCDSSMLSNCTYQYLRFVEVSSNFVKSALRNSPVHEVQLLRFV